MTKQTITRAARDNVYLHQDFHGALSTGIEYLHQKYGAQAVRDYLREFASTFYAPLTLAVRERGLVALKEHLEYSYGREGGKIRCQLRKDELRVEVEACPAVVYMRQHGYRVAELFYETSKTVYATVCEGTPFAFEWLEYDEQSGRTVMRFARRPE